MARDELDPRQLRGVVVKVELPLVVFVDADPFGTGRPTVARDGADRLHRRDGWEGITLVRVGLEEDFAVGTDHPLQAADGLEASIEHRVDVFPLDDDQEWFA